MGLDNIQLPPIVLQYLFKNSLVDLKEDKVTDALPSSAEITFLGDNEKKIAIIINDKKSIYLPDEDLHFLIGILAACKLTMADVALINISGYNQISYTALEQHLSSEKILLFGVKPAELQLPLQFPEYQVQHFNNQLFLAAPSLALLAKDKGEKLKLWNCLKQIFVAK